MTSNTEISLGLRRGSPFSFSNPLVATVIWGTFFFIHFVVIIIIIDGCKSFIYNIYSIVLFECFVLSIVPEDFKQKFT